MAFPAPATNGFYELIDRLDEVYDTNFGKSEILTTKEEENYRKMYISLTFEANSNHTFFGFLTIMLDTGSPHLVRPHLVRFHVSSTKIHSV